MIPREAYNQVHFHFAKSLGSPPLFTQGVWRSANGIVLRIEIVLGLEMELWLHLSDYVDSVAFSDVHHSTTMLHLTIVGVLAIGHDLSNDHDLPHLSGVEDEKQ
jgi:hypothetical protein